MSNVQLATAIIEAEARDKIAVAITVEDKLKAAFNVARDHWMFTDVAIQQMAAIGAVMVNLDKEGEDYKRIEHELKMHNSLNAMVSGIPIDIERAFPPLDPKLKPIGITRLWYDKV